MRTARWLVGFGLMAILAATVSAQTKAPAELNGRWEGVRTGEGGRTEPVALEFKVAGDKTFTGMFYRSGREFGAITNGKISGNKVTWLVADIDFAGVIDGNTMTVSVLFINETQEFKVTKKDAGQ